MIPVQSFVQRSYWSYNFCSMPLSQWHPLREDEMLNKDPMVGDEILLWGALHIVYVLVFLSHQMLGWQRVNILSSIPTFKVWRRYTLVIRQVKCAFWVGHYNHEVSDGLNLEPPIPVLNIVKYHLKSEILIYCVHEPMRAIDVLNIQ